MPIFNLEKIIKYRNTGNIIIDQSKNKECLKRKKEKKRCCTPYNPDLFFFFLETMGLV